MSPFFCFNILDFNPLFINNKTSISFESKTTIFEIKDNIPMILSEKNQKASTTLSYNLIYNNEIIIPKIVKVYNEETILDWNNSNVYKYLPYYKKVSSAWVFDGYGIWSSYANGSAGHHYKNSDLLYNGCKNFNQIYIDFYSFNG